MANTDEQQYNPTQYFAARTVVGTNADISLVPTDGPVITADSNLTDEAPVNTALKKDKDTLFGLRAAIIGDFAGAVQKTLRSLKIDTTGGVTHTAPAGTIEAEDDITSENGDLLAPNGGLSVGQAIQTSGGNVYAQDPGSIMQVGDPALERCNQTRNGFKVLSTGTGSGDGNPPQATALPNELRAKNIPKASLCLEMTVANAVASQKGYGCVFGSFVNLSVPVAAVAGTTRGIEIIFNTAFADKEFQVTTTGTATAVTPWPLTITEDKALRTFNSCVLFFMGQSPVMGITFGLDPTTAPVSFSLHADGEQTT